MNLIVAMSRNFIIGRRNKLPWYLPDDLKRFKELTTGNVVIMGRKTYESIGKPLPNRTNIVISKTLSDQDGIIVCKSVDECLNKIKDITTEVFVIGGAEIYKLFFPYVKKLFITIVDTDIRNDECATKFPDFDFNVNIISNAFHEKDEKNVYSFRTYELEIIEVEE